MRLKTEKLKETERVQKRPERKKILLKKRDRREVKEDKGREKMVFDALTQMLNFDINEPDSTETEKKNEIEEGSEVLLMLFQ